MLVFHPHSSQLDLRTVCYRNREAFNVPSPSSSSSWFSLLIIVTLWRHASVRYSCLCSGCNLISIIITDYGERNCSLLYSYILNKTTPPSCSYTEACKDLNATTICNKFLIILVLISFCIMITFVSIFIVLYLPQTYNLVWWTHDGDNEARTLPFPPRLVCRRWV